MRKSLFFVVVLACLVSRAEEKPKAIPSLSKAPTIDGKIDEDEWSNAMVVTEFEEKRKMLSPEEHGPLTVESRLGKTDSALYASFNCRHDRPDMIANEKTLADSPVYADDSVEVFVDSHGDREDYFHVITNINGAIYDAYTDALLKCHLDWNSGSVAKGTKTDDGFIIELMIPLSSLDLGKNDSGEVNLNLCRSIRYIRSAKAAFGEYHKPRTWTPFSFKESGGDYYPATIENIQWSDYAGDNQTVCEIRNLTDKPQALTVAFETDQDGEKREQEDTVTLAPKATDQLTFPANLVAASLAAQRISVTDAKGREVLCANRSFNPCRRADFALDTDIAYRDDKLHLGVSLNLPKSDDPANYVVETAMFSKTGETLIQPKVVKPQEKTFKETIDLSKISKGARDVALRCLLKNAKTGTILQKSVFPIRLMNSPWARQNVARQ